MRDDGRPLYTAVAHNRTGAHGESWADGGLRVAVRPPLTQRGSGEGVLAAADGPAAAGPAPTNPEELLALAWATCLAASSRIVADGREVAVRVEVALRDDPAGPGFAFVPTAFVSFEDATPEEAERLAAAAHARCPMSKLLTGRGTAQIRVEPYAQQ